MVTQSGDVGVQDQYGSVEDMMADNRADSEVIMSDGNFVITAATATPIYVFRPSESAFIHISDAAISSVTLNGLKKDDIIVANSTGTGLKVRSLLSVNID